MAFGMGEQLERGRWLLRTFGDDSRPWWRWNRWRRPYKANKARRERRRAKADPECMPEYRRYDGYEL